MKSLQQKNPPSPPLGKGGAAAIGKFVHKSIENAILEKRYRSEAVDFTH